MVNKLKTSRGVVDLGYCLGRTEVSEEDWNAGDISLQIIAPRDEHTPPQEVYISGYEELKWLHNQLGIALAYAEKLRGGEDGN